MVEVRDGLINAITVTRADGVPVAEVDPSEFKTIEELYAIIENDAARADLIVTAFAFHPSFWYPRVRVRVARGKLKLAPPGPVRTAPFSFYGPHALRVRFWEERIRLGLS
jgi:hypothetical protein